MTKNHKKNHQSQKTRRKYIAAAGAALTLGVAGCTSEANCDSSGKRASITGFASTEAIFVSLESSGLFSGDFKPKKVPENKIEKVERNIGATQPLSPVTKAMDVDPDGYGPYTGYFVHDNFSIDSVVNQFENFGFESDYDWWRFQNADWNGVQKQVQKRYEAAKQFEATKSGVVPLPKVSLRTTNNGERGENAAWDFFGVSSKAHAKNTVTALGNPTGLAVYVPDSWKQSRQYVKPLRFIDDVNVYGQKGVNTTNFTTTLTLNPDAVDEYLDDVGADPDSINIETSAGIELDAVLSDDGSKPVAKYYAKSWPKAYALATAYVAPVKNPLFVNGDLSSCSSE